MGRRVSGWLLVGVAVLAACDATPGYLQEQGRRQRLADAGVEGFDTTGSFQLAGMSTYRIIDIEALEPRRLGRDTLDTAFHTYRMRCGSCHVVPSPDTKPAYLWDATVSRMKKNAAAAGLMPMSRHDEAVVLGFLREHAAERR